MTHPVQEAQVDAWLDNELAPVEVGVIEAHLAECPECRRYRDDRLALRAALRGVLRPLKAPEALRQRILSDLRAVAAPRRSRFAAGAARWAALAATLLLAVAGGWQAGRHQAESIALADQVLQTHVRGLMPGHLTDVVSSDQHTVKPWFDGVLDYSPPVSDFSGRGYPLLGGRLDYLGDRPVAALVYGRRKHLITVLVWPTGHGPAAGAASRFRQGYHLLHWSTPDYVYWVASDLGLTELTEFAGLIRQSDSAMTGGEH